ncbi:ADP-ribosylglycohydrolase family protein [Thermodesulfobacteriota bacterium]
MSEKNSNIQSSIPLESRIRGALYGLFIGDALAMPVHWYYDRNELKRDYGHVTDYMPPKNPHPGSILSYKSYEPLNKKGEILHEQKKYWGKKGVHYHQFLKAGENTLNMKLVTLVINSLNEKGSYDADDYLDRYISFMTTPGNHMDTYVEEYHRHFFAQYAQGKSPRKCGMKEKHIGGLVGLVPIILFHNHDPGRAKQAALEHLSLTHLGDSMEEAAGIIINILLNLLTGESFENEILKSIGGMLLPFDVDTFLRWIDEADENIVGGKFSTACYVQESIPSLLYLAYKYRDKSEEGVIANTNLGGDNAYRGAVLGALLGTANGFDCWPERWVNGLIDPPPDLKMGKAD